MRTVSLAEAKAHLSELLNAVEAGDEVVITRHGRPIARVCSVAQPKVPIKSLAAFRAGMPRWRRSSVELIGEMREEDG